MMHIAWVTTGMAAFRDWPMDTRRTEVPRIGEMVLDGSDCYRVRDVAWNYRAQTVFVHLDRIARE